MAISSEVTLVWSDLDALLLMFNSCLYLTAHDRFDKSVNCDTDLPS